MVVLHARGADVIERAAMRPANHAEAPHLTVIGGTSSLPAVRHAAAHSAGRPDLHELMVTGDHELIHELPAEGDLSLTHGYKRIKPSPS